MRTLAVIGLPAWGHADRAGDLSDASTDAPTAATGSAAPITSPPELLRKAEGASSTP